MSVQQWRVERHGGRSTDKWRVVYSGPDEARARAVFTRERERMRQGGVQLVGPDGKVVASSWAPRLRTRW